MGRYRHDSTLLTLQHPLPKRTPIYPSFESIDLTEEMTATSRTTSRPRSIHIHITSVTRHTNLSRAVIATLPAVHCGDTTDTSASARKGGSERIKPALRRRYPCKQCPSAEHPRSRVRLGSVHCDVVQDRGSAVRVRSRGVDHTSICLLRKRDQGSIRLVTLSLSPLEIGSGSHKG